MLTEGVYYKPMETIIIAIQWTFGSGSLVLGAFAAKEYVIGHIEEAGRRNAERTLRAANR